MFDLSQLLHYPSRCLVLQKKEETIADLWNGGWWWVDMWAAQREISAYSPLKSPSSSIPRYLRCHMLHCCNCCGIIRYVKAMPKSYTKCPRVSSLPFFCMFVCVCECAYVLAYISVKAFSLLFWQRNRNIWLASLAPHWFSLSAIWHILFSVHSCLMQLSEPENLGSMTGTPRRQSDKQTDTRLHTFTDDLLTPLPFALLCESGERVFLFRFLFPYSQMYFPLAFLPHKDFEAH